MTVTFQYANGNRREMDERSAEILQRLKKGVVVAPRKVDADAQATDAQATDAQDATRGPVAATQDAPDGVVAAKGATRATDAPTQAQDKGKAPTRRYARRDMRAKE